MANSSESLESIKLKAYVNLLTKDDKFMHSLMVLLGSIGVFTAIHFYPFPLAVLLSFLSALVSYKTRPEYGVLAFMLLALPAFSYQSPVFLWFYFLLLAILLFNVWKYWDMITAFQIIVFLPFSPFPISLLGGFVYLALIVSALYFGSKKSVALAVISVYLILLLSAIWGVENSAYFPLAESYETHELLQRKSPVDFYEFGDAVEEAFSNMFDFEKMLLFSKALGILWEDTIKMLFEDTLLLQIIIWVAVLYTASLIPGYKEVLKTRYIELKSSSLILLVPVGYYFIYQMIDKPYPIAIPAYTIASMFIIYLLESQGFRFSRELEIRKRKEEKEFGRFGFKELSLSKGERGLEDVGGYEDVKKELKEAILLPLKKPEIAYAYKLKPPRGILLFGPPGTGKTMIMRALAKEIEYPFFYVKTSELLSHLYGESEKNIAEVFERARKHSPAILFFDEIDAIAKKRGEGHDDITPRVLSTLLQELDGFREDKPIIFIGATNVPDKIDPALLRPGRVDKVIYMRPPTKEERKEIFKVHCRDLPIAKDVDFDKLAELTERFTGADIANVVNEAKRLAAERAKKTLKISPITMQDFLHVLERVKPSTTTAELEKYEKFKIEFERRMEEKKERREGMITFEDVVDLEKVKKALKEAIEIPIKHPELMKRYNLKPIKGILLFGPPGTGKTYVVKAAANEFGLNLYSLSGAELLKEPYRAAAKIKATFGTARDNKPSLIFIDEIDSIGQSRDKFNLLSQLLQEMDGIKENSVLVIGATNAPHLLDPALLRPGRFDKIIYVGLPTQKDREELLKLYLGDLAEKIDVKEIARKTKGYSSADITNICREIKYRLLEKEIKGETPKLEKKEIDEILKKTKPSVGKHLLSIYKKFMEEYGERS